MQTTLKNNTSSISVDVLMINDRGIMISVQGQDYFLSYNRVPWMRDATINEVLDVQMSGKNAIEWPKLDVDLEVASSRKEPASNRAALAMVFPPETGRW